jgi:hypothetical protein
VYSVVDPAALWHSMYILYTVLQHFDKPDILVRASQGAPCSVSWRKIISIVVEHVPRFFKVAKMFKSLY